ncbi:hypothetical protein X975_21943, partial [Stegodyphus mimosarum]
MIIFITVSIFSSTNVLHSSASEPGNRAHPSSKKVRTIVLEPGCCNFCLRDEITSLHTSHSRSFTSSETPILVNCGQNPSAGQALSGFNSCWRMLIRASTFWFMKSLQSSLRDLGKILQA